MKKIKSLIALGTLLIVFFTCSENDPAATPPEEEKPEPTSIGIPIGPPNSKTIGASGGTISSLDGMMGLEIPAGALSADTEISIQPITNFAPNGNGNAYQLGPEGTEFKKQIKITFRYEGDISATTPPLTGIAFQDTDGIWYSSGKFTWDITNKTVVTETNHFSGWATFNTLKIYGSAKAVVDQYGQTLFKMKANESATFNIRTINSDALIASDGGDELIPLKTNNYDYGAITKAWAANGDVNGFDEKGNPSKFGKISVNAADGVCTYTAPASRPPSPKNPVQLSVYLKDLKYKYKDANGSVQILKDLLVNTQIDITGEFDFSLEIKYNDPLVSGGWGEFTMTDLATLKIHVDGEGNVTASDTTNTPGVITPGSSIKFTCTYTWVPVDVSGGNGITVTSATGETFPIQLPGKQPRMYLNIAITGNYQNPKWKAICEGSDLAVFQGGESQSDLPLFGPTFVLKDSMQTILDPSKAWFAKLIPE